MNKLFKALVISLTIFTIHIVISFCYYYLVHQHLGFYGLGWIIYGFIFGFGIYYFFVLTYLYLTKSALSFQTRLLVASILAVLGYFAARTGDIIDGDFLRKFDTLLFILFMATSFLLVWLDRFFGNRNLPGNKRSHRGPG